MIGNQRLREDNILRLDLDNTIEKDYNSWIYGLINRDFRDFLVNNPINPIKLEYCSSKKSYRPMIPPILPVKESYVQIKYNVGIQ